MVMGPTHAMSGAAAGFVLPLVLPGVPHTPAMAFTYAGVCAGAALLPDIDSPGSTVSRSLGPLTWLLSKAISKVSWAFYQLTASHRDNRTGSHRTLTHTALFTVLIGGGIAALTGWGGKGAVAGVLFFMASLAIRGLLADWAKKNGWVAITVVAAVLTFVAWQTLPAGGQAWLGVAVGAGVFLHDLGDAITQNGCAFLAPFARVKGKNWWEFSLPSGLRITAGGAGEKVALLPVLTVLTVVLAINSIPEGASALTSFRHWLF